MPTTTLVRFSILIGKLSCTPAKNIPLLVVTLLFQDDLVSFIFAAAFDHPGLFPFHAPHFVDDFHIPQFLGSFLQSESQCLVLHRYVSDLQCLFHFHLAFIVTLIVAFFMVLVAELTVASSSDGFFLGQFASRNCLELDAVLILPVGLDFIWFPDALRIKF